jgi:hypothetical protein
MVMKIAFPPLPLEQFKALKSQAQESTWKALCDSVSAKWTAGHRVDSLRIVDVPGNKALRVIVVKQAGQLVVLFIGSVKDTEVRKLAHDVEILTKVEGLDPVEVSINPKEFSSVEKVVEVIEALERRSEREKMCSPKYRSRVYQHYAVDVSNPYWNVRKARAKMGDLLDKAVDAPQIVQRRDRRYVLALDDRLAGEFPTAGQDLEFFFSRRAPAMVPEFSEGSMPDAPLLG